MKKFLKNIIIVTLSVFIISGAGYVLAQPTNLPGAADILFFLDTGADPQAKVGPLTLPELCFVNGGCQKSWAGVNVVSETYSAISVNSTTDLSDPQVISCYSSLQSTVNYYNINGNPYTASLYNCTQAFSFKVPVLKVALSLDSIDIKCFRGYKSGSVYGKNGAYYTLPTNVTVSLDDVNQEALVTGDCLAFWSPVGDQYSFVDASIDGLFIQ